MSATTSEAVYAELLQRVGEAKPRPRIEPVRRLAELAGSPQLSFPVIQVAGTNGKTSTSRAIESLMRAHGLRTGLFTSPHLVDFTERFQIGGEAISGEALTAAWQELQPPLETVDAELVAAGNGPITFFEALAVLAFTAFTDAPVDVAIIEVGMGGEWDATNIADAQVAVFTPIDLDHTAILGPDIESIARTKAGIVKPGTAVVSAEQDPDAVAELEAATERHGVPLLLQGRDFQLTDDRLAVGGRMITVAGLTGGSYAPTFVPLFGHHQAQNAALAIAAVEAFFGGGRAIAEEVLEEGFGQLTSPGRLQLIGTDPMIYVDAAHNPHGAEALSRAVAESFSFDELALVVGVLAEKDAAGLLAALAPIAHRITLTPVDSERTIAAAELAAMADTEVPGTPVEIAESLPEALDEARAWAGRAPNRGVLVVGSVLLAGEAIAFARSEGWGIA
ncbi:dihydrofolate synthase/folylpolyglutamate synthase [Leucobacter luti]|uniref:bifunctional folylpolyglutamate synthase/dihydrofolate synthase n=1 Tax=Leucobacter luti TaxID=340320 RepID=UPI00105352F6|nr:folylpolyglutamate synthase/dihydrofolate synthase family protein [Leucobacter luti]MCW2287790.1 dihydrofolate synthase/folylpolyglutamate synthase [Leucobacter luti]TCK46047.1 dihydrofolate synthase/folylpolyglutamate synthase [Leucobacter luti]